MSLASQIPSAPATRPGEAAREDLWRGCASLYAPCVQRGLTDATHTARNFPLPDLGTNRLAMRKSGGGLFARSPFGGSLVFTGASGGYLEASGALDNLSFVQKTAKFTIAALVRSDNVSSLRTMMDNAQGTSTSSGFLFAQNSSGNILFQAYRASAGNTTLNMTGSTALVLGQWTLIIVKCDGTTGSIWLNGHRGATDASVTVLSSTDSAFSTAIGCYGGGANSNVWSGQIAYIGVWNRCWAQRAVQELTADPLLLFRRPPVRIGKSVGSAGSLVGGGLVGGKLIGGSLLRC